MKHGGSIPSKRAAVYARISSDREGESLGVTRQEEDGRALAERLGYEVVHVYIDNDRSASTRTKTRRPEYAAMLDAARGGQLDAIVAYSNSRLTRRPREVEDLIELHERYGVRLHTVVSGDDDLSTADGRMIARIKGNVDAAEAERTAERVSRAALQAAQAGKWHGGPRPFGFESDGVTIREVEAVAIREGYGLIVAGGSLGTVMRLWNGRGLYTGRTGRPWTLAGVRELLASPRYAGKRAYRGEIVADAEWDPIVDEVTWKTVHSILRDPSRKRVRAQTRHLLSGVARCGVCGGPISSRGGRAGRPAYRCAASDGHVSRTGDRIDEYVSEVALRRLKMPDVAEALAERRQAPDTAALRDRARTLHARLDQMAVEFADGTLTASQLRAATGRLREQIDGVEEQIAAGSDTDILGPIIGAEDIEAKWNALDTDTRRTVIDTLMTITVMPTLRGSRAFHPESVVIEWKGAK